MKLKWIDQTLSLGKSLSVSLACFTMVMSPLAQGAEAAKAAKNNLAPLKVAIDYDKYNFKVDKEGVQSFLKYTGVGGKKKVSVGEYYQKVRGMYPRPLRDELDMWVQLNRNELMPEVQVTTYKNAEGKEQIRLLVSKEGQTATLAYNNDSDDKYLKFNNTYIAKGDILYHDQLTRKLVTYDAATKKDLQKKGRVGRLKNPVKLSYEEYRRMTPRQRAEYMVRLRELIEAAQDVEQAFNGKETANNTANSYEFFAQWAMGLKAEAAGTTTPDREVRGARVGGPCIVSGYSSKYGENFSCGGTHTGREDLIAQMKVFGGGQCPDGSVSCNPLLYGRSSSGSAYCVKAGKALQDATYGPCQKASPLKTAADKKRLIEDFMKSQGQGIDLKIDADGKKASKEGLNEDQFKLVTDYIDSVNKYVEEAVQKCTSAKSTKVRPEQKLACEAIAQRKINLDFYDVAKPPTPEPPPPVAACPGDGQVQDENGVCTCPPGSSVDLRNGVSCIADEAKPAREDKQIGCHDDQYRDKDSADEDNKGGACEAVCGHWCKYKGWYIAGAGLLIGGGLFAWLGKKKDSPSTNAATYVAPCVPATIPLTTTCNVTPTTPPNPQPPPPIVTTPTTPTTPTAPPIVVEYTGSTSSSSAGGARSQIRGTR
jgi:hypothetical protein